MAEIITASEEGDLAKVRSLGERGMDKDAAGARQGHLEVMQIVQYLV